MNGQRESQPPFLSRNQALAFSKYLDRCHSLKEEDREKCIPFTVDDRLLGWVVEKNATHLLGYPNVFKRENEAITLTDPQGDYNDRTVAIDRVMRDLHLRGLEALKGWREEMFPVVSQFNSQPVFEVERAATPLLGIKTYGCHVNGYVIGPNDDIQSLWVARRSKSKPTWPNCLDNVVAGGLPVGISVKANVVKECEEEGSIPQSLATKAKPVGAISYTSISQRGVKPETQFVYDLVLPPDFKPIPKDGEVDEFYCWPLEKVAQSIETEPWKANAALVVLDFMIRHGVITPDN
eukprot:Ihof_evm3s634 gene=Ihof_evmTU3s634